MKDKLEQLVKSNRQAFDDKEPRDHVWSRISDELHTKSYQWLWKAAAIVFFVSTIGLATQLAYTAQEKTANKELASTDFEDVEEFYFNMISEKKSMIYDFEERNVAINQDFEQDMQKLDAMYMVLKEELKTNPSKKVVDALILNLLVRIDILNKQLQQLDETTNEQPDDEEESSLNT